MSRVLRKALQWVADRVRGQHSLEWFKDRGLRAEPGVWIGRTAVLDDGFLWLISIGADSTLSGRVRVLAHDASMRKGTGRTIVGRVQIGSRVFVGSDTVILPGVTIGDDCVIGANSVVRTDIPPNSIAVGSPAKVVGQTDEHLAKHMELMKTRPVWGREYTIEGAITQDRMDEMWHALADGPGYVP